MPCETLRIVYVGFAYIYGLMRIKINVIVVIRKEIPVRCDQNVHRILAPEVVGQAVNWRCAAQRGSIGSWILPRHSGPF